MKYKCKHLNSYRFYSSLKPNEEHTELDDLVIVEMLFEFCPKCGIKLRVGKINKKRKSYKLQI